MELKLFNNFIEKTECDLIINYINNNLDEFQSFQDNKYFIKMFGKDNYHKSSIDLNETKEIKDIVIKYFEKCIHKIKNEFNYTGDLYASSFWISKQTSGAHLDIHGDNDLGTNPHILYTCSIYLNDVTKEGYLSFPNLNYSYQPKCGDLLCFPSQNNKYNYDHEIRKIIDTRYTILIWLGNDIEYKINY